ncbi:hypothetical protein HSBAA_49050 [Vreelandella sulfidaeris]|uniref:UspA domain-containing protein n=1 Tax=Vreelandella sulfidaeris TaxID=115553 RepID=A0A455UHA8_9GAMM|nr:hypothetical protein HSBAA_49050 [Halomonas sulfidaeris]
MFTNIMVPVDLAHLEALEPALSVVADLAKQYDAHITYVSVTANTPTSIARTPQEYQQSSKLSRKSAIRFMVNQSAARFIAQQILLRISTRC